MIRMSGDGKVILALLTLIIAAGIIVFIYICLRKKKRHCCKKQNDFESVPDFMLENESGKKYFENYSGKQMDPESRSIEASNSILEDKSGKIFGEINSENTLITL